VKVRAAYSKHRREDTLPLRRELADGLGAFLSGKAPAAQVFCLSKFRRYAATMFREDVEAAGLPYRDDDGLVADFHSLRHTFVTNLANGGVHPKVAQELARHSTVTLTMDRYTHVLHADQVAALNVLPDLSAVLETAQATGTDETVSISELPIRPRHLARSLAQTGERGRTPVDSGGRNDGILDSSQSTKNKRLPAQTGSRVELRRGVRVAEGAGLENR